MKRKIIKLGTATLVASLPTKWTRKTRVKAGDYINVEERKGSLIFSPETQQNETEKLLDFRGINTKLALHFLRATYCAGFDKIEVSHNSYIEGYMNYKKLKSTEFIQQLVNTLIGIEITEQNENKTVIKDLGEVSDKEADNILKRAFFLISSMADECLEAIRETDSEHLKEIKVRHDNVIRFLSYYRRILAKKGYKEFNKTSIMCELTSHLKAIADVYRFIASETLGFKKHYNTKALSIFKLVNSSLQKFYKVFFNFKPEIAMEITSEREKTWTLINAEKSKCSKENAFLYGRLAVIVLNILKGLEDRFALEL